MKITRYILPINKKIAVLADIHDKMFDLSLLEKEKVDMILIPGDICSSHLSREAYEKADESVAIKGNEWYQPKVALELLSVLPQIAPTFFSIGNHEFYWNETDRQIVRESGTVLLDNEYVREQGILLGGITSISRYTEKRTEIPGHITEFISDFTKEKGTKILLLHEPHLFYEYGIGKTDIDLTVSGHAHGGQWRLFGRGVLAPGQGLFPKYTKGIYDNKLLVSAGMTNTVEIIPRFFNPTEMVIIEKG